MNNDLKPSAASIGVVAPLYALVRDSNGRPKIDDGNFMPDWAQKDLLTQEEIQKLKDNPFVFKPTSLN